MFDRRDLLKGAGLAAVAATLNSTKALALDTVTLPFANGERPLRRLRLERPRSRHDSLKTRQKVGNRSGKHERALRRLHADRHLEEQRILKKLP